MTLSRPSWWLLVAVATTALSAATALSVGFTPTAADLIDPLGRPVALSRSIVRSTATVDRLAADIHEKHRKITGSSRTAISIADHLDQVVAHADPLLPLSVEAQRRTGQLAAGLQPLPPLVTVLTGHTGRATDVADDLGTHVDDVAEQLRDIGARLSDITDHLDPLVPQTQALATVLEKLTRDTAPLRPLGPILGNLGPALAGAGR